MAVNPVWFFLLYRFLAALLARSFTPQSAELHSICIFENLAYRGISNFSEVDKQPHLLLCWIAGESAKIADQLDDEEVFNLVLKVEY